MSRRTFKRLFPFTARIINQSRGVAILMTLFFMTFMIFLVTSLSYETIVEYSVASQKVNRLKAYYAAKSGIEVSLLRILVYQKARAAFGQQLEKTHLLDVIWSFPFAWPISSFITENVSRTDTELIKDIEKDSSMDASYTTDILLESSRININDLGSFSKALQNSTKTQILNIFLKELESNEDFEEKYGDFDFEALVNHITDWIDPDNESLNGGDEKSYYYEFEEIDFSSFNNDFFPPNEPLKTPDELLMVAMMDDELFDLIKEHITIFGPKGVNINQASREVLLSLHKDMTEEIVNDIILRRDNPDLGGPFKNEEDFINFITNLNPSLIHSDTFSKDIILQFDKTYTFRITSVGQFAQSIQEIVAIAYDFESTKKQLTNILEKEDRQSTGSSTRNPESPPKNTKPLQGPPHIVYWQEK